ncbi:hypothetical protein QCA50_004195 [Cerrena zonata]|uniref:Uncharacterized protein n=1 Tax=Cerrena zonata TaxID=2478898 RepID=A0AAW0GH46_9APHY
MPVEMQNFKHISVRLHQGGSLMPHSRADPNGPLARKERYDRLDRFVRTWCTMGMPGTKPFFEGLWAGHETTKLTVLLSASSVCSGKDFMLDAIDVLKGVLGFEELLSSRRSSSTPNSPYPTISRVHSRSQSQPLPSQQLSAPSYPQKSPPIISTTLPKRARAPSDPFLDTPPLSTSYSSGNTTAQLSTSGSSTVDEPPTPVTPRDDPTDYFNSSAGRELPDLDEYLRTWTAPDLSEPEYLNLLTIFPTFIVRHPLPTFPVPSKSRRFPDIEEGEAVVEERKDIRVGTGTMWVGPKTRSPGWQGSWWTRFKLWWKRLFS